MKKRVSWVQRKVLTSKVILALAIIIFGIAGPIATEGAAHAATNDVISGVAGKCIDVKGGKAQSKSKVQLYSCNNTAAQTWDMPGDGTIRNHGLCLDVKGGSTAPKATVQLYTCNSTKSQQWTVNSNGTITSSLSNLCLDDSYGITKNSNPLWVYSCNTTVSQTWTSPTIKQVAAAKVAADAAAKAAQQQAAEQAAQAQAAQAASAAAAQSTSSSGSGYINSAGNYVQSPSSNPQGATAQCKDGTYSYSQSRSGTCSHHGGVAQWL